MKRDGRIVVLPVHVDEKTANQIDRLCEILEIDQESLVLVAMAYGVYLPSGEDPPVKMSGRREIAVGMSQQFSDILRGLGIQTASARGALAGRGLAPVERMKL